MKWYFVFATCSEKAPMRMLGANLIVRGPRVLETREAGRRGGRKISCATTKSQKPNRQSSGAPGWLAALGSRSRDRAASQAPAGPRASTRPIQRALLYNPNYIYAHRQFQLLLFVHRLYELFAPLQQWRMTICSAVLDRSFGVRGAIHTRAD